jgi:hypothetical protein
MKLFTAGVAAFVIILALGSEAGAQTLTLTLSRNNFTYPSGDPDTTPTVSSPVITVTYRVQYNWGHNWHLAVRANGDLANQLGGASIPTTNTTWTGTFGTGTLTNSNQTLASGTNNVNPARTGNITFLLQNLWTYSAGTYTQTIVFTLSVP